MAFELNFYDQGLSCQKMVPLKIGPAGPILSAKNGSLLPESVPHGGLILAKLSAKIGPPSKWHSYSYAYMATWMQL